MENSGCEIKSPATDSFCNSPLFAAFSRTILHSLPFIDRFLTLRRQQVRENRAHKMGWREQNACYKAKCQEKSASINIVLAAKENFALTNNFSSFSSENCCRPDNWIPAKNEVPSNHSHIVIFENVSLAIATHFLFHFVIAPNSIFRWSDLKVCSFNLFCSKILRERTE